MSMHSEPRRAPAKTPSAPLNTFITISSLGRQESTTLEPAESSATLPATTPPYCTSSCALLRSRSYAELLRARQQREGECDDSRCRQALPVFHRHSLCGATLGRGRSGRAGIVQPVLP